MSQLAHQSREHPSDASGRPQQDNQYHNHPGLPYSPTHAGHFNHAQDSPPIGRAQIQSIHSGPVPGPITIVAVGAYASSPSSTFGSSPTSPLSGTGARFRKPVPSPLHNTTAISPPNSYSPSKPTFNDSFGAHGSPISTPTTPSASQSATRTALPESEPISPRQKGQDSLDADKLYYKNDSLGAATPEDKSATGLSLSLRFPNESRSVSDPVKKPLGVSTNTSSQATLGSSRMEAVKGAPRNSSIDSAISAISTVSSTPRGSQDVASSPADIAKLIKAAGSPEAVIQYLLKEKQSQSQQNAQLWRLVDKQRAMILGLNKDLERALKDKEKYRKKLKEIMTLQTIPPVPSTSLSALQDSGRAVATSSANDEAEASKRPALEVPVSPSVDSDSMRHSPIDVSLAPYPITPPADQGSNGPPSLVGEILDPSHSMPEASEHALDNFDHEVQEREAEEARKQTDDRDDLHIKFSIPPSKGLPDQLSPLRGSLPPATPQQAAHADSDPSATDDDNLSRFPLPLPPPRKPPPAPLQLKDSQQSPTYAPEEDVESDTDYDNILEVDEITVEKRGRRRTRQEDDQIREIVVLKESEARSLSKKSKSSSSAEETLQEAAPEIQLPASPPTASPSMLNRPNVPGSLGSLAGMLGGDPSGSATLLTSPGLPSSPRPVTLLSGQSSPPLSPRQSGVPPAPLSPRAPRQQIPLPPNTPLQTPSPPGDPFVLKSPQPLNIVKKKVAESEPADSPTSSSHDSITALQTDRNKIYKGFATEEFPDLLLPPNALPSVGVKVASSRMKPSRASLMSLTQLEEDPVFTLAIQSRSDGGELWRVEKDSVSLAKLDQRLKQCPDFTARTPDRSLFSGHAPAKLDARRLALNQYLDELLNTPLDTAAAVELCRYLSTNVLPPNADEMGSSRNSADEGASKVGPGGRPYKSGYLTKRGKNFGGWKARFFSIEGPYLKYFETPGGAHLGTIKLVGAQIGKQSHQNDTSSPARISDEADNQYRHAFLILEPKKKDPTTMTKHVLCAESDGERDEWVEVLLRWTAYKDPADEENRRDQVHDRQGSNSGHVKGASAKKKMYGQGRPQQPQPKDSEDTLIGLSYEATKQGDIPSGAPGGFIGHEHPEPSPAGTMSSQPSYSISAPRDPQVISDSSTWGNKMGAIPPPGVDEKKARKRSFFGFGPKQRSSSEGADSLSENANGSSKEVYSGPVRRVFGAPLAEAVRYNPPRDSRVPLPAVVYRCIQYLDAKGAVLEEGIFRLSGSNVVIKQLKERFDTEGDVNLLADEEYHDIHAIASMLKAYLRELPSSILTRDLHLEFVAVTEMNSQAEKIAVLSELVVRLPQANATLLKYLIAFLVKVISNADRNKMTVRNVGIVFSPTLTIPAPVFALLLQNYQAIFGFVPEEYELTSPASLEERHEKAPVDIPQRPSTSGGMRESPHRHRLAEALQEGRRGNTPPPAGLNPLGGFTQTRSTTTPPPAQQRSYDAQYLSQQNAGSHVSFRPAYESVLMPPGFDPTQNYAAQQQQRMVNPGYDRPIYETGAGYDQPYASRSNRRESSIFTGTPRGLTPQGSMSRLKEESQF